MAMIGPGRLWHDIPGASERADAAYGPLISFKAWRNQKFDAGRPSSLEDCLRAHGMCLACRGDGLDPYPTGADGDWRFFRSARSVLELDLHLA